MYRLCLFDQCLCPVFPYPLLMFVTQCLRMHPFQLSVPICDFRIESVNAFVAGADKEIDL